MPEATITGVPEKLWKWTELLYYIIMNRMTKASTMLSVRLDPALAAALERHCAQTGATRSRVVQQSMAQYLVAQSGPTLGELAEALLPPLPKRAAGTFDVDSTRNYLQVRL